MAKQYHVFLGDVVIAVARDRQDAIEQATRWAQDEGIVGDDVGGITLARFLRTIKVEETNVPETKKGSGHARA